MKANFCPQCGNPLETATLNGQDRRCCKAVECQYVFWNNPIPVVAAIVEVNGVIILARNKGWPEKQYGLITGFLEPGETPDAAIQREVREELGLETQPPHFIGNYAFFEMNQLLIAYHLLAQGDREDIVLGEELADIKCVPVERLKPWTIGTGPAVRDWLAHRIASG